jgi:hypothetical protein
MKRAQKVVVLEETEEMVKKGYYNVLTLNGGNYSNYTTVPGLRTLLSSTSKVPDLSALYRLRVPENPLTSMIEAKNLHKLTRVIPMDVKVRQKTVLTNYKSEYWAIADSNYDRVHFSTIEDVLDYLDIAYEPETVIEVASRFPFLHNVLESIEDILDEFDKDRFVKSKQKVTQSLQNMRTILYLTHIPHQMNLTLQALH